jgi:membrane protein
LANVESLKWLITGVAHHGIPIITNVIVFSIIFKYLHDGKVDWKTAIKGSALTTALLYLGQLLIKYYLLNYFFGTGGGVAGTMLIILVWVYYSSQIIFFGAKFIAVYSKMTGAEIKYRN